MLNLEDELRQVVHALEAGGIPYVLRARQHLDWGGKRLWIVSVEGLRTLKRLRASPQDLADLEALGPEGQE